MVSLIQPGTFLLEKNGNLGAVEIMTFLSLILLGISLSLGYTFFRRSEGDRFSLKVLVRAGLTDGDHLLDLLSKTGDCSLVSDIYSTDLLYWTAIVQAS